MNLRIPTAVTTAALVITGMIPVGFALTANDMNPSATTTSSQSSMPFWSTDISLPSSTTLGISCVGMTGESLSQCLRQSGVFNGSNLLNGTGTGNVLLMQCTQYTGTQRSDCEWQRLQAWQMSYGMFRRWVDQMDRQLQQGMANAGLTTAQVNNIISGTLNVQTTTDGYADTETMREAWEVCKQFNGRAQARCMRDALTNDINFENRFRGWADLQESLNGSDVFDRSSSRSSRSMSSSSLSN